MKLNSIPQRFCWTRFGTESGEPIEEILARKDRERSANRGLFLWGVGNSVAPAMRALLRTEREPIAIFSPMRAKPKAIDVVPASIVVWRVARGLDGVVWDIPHGSTVVSRASKGVGQEKRTHYALVCRSDVPLPTALSSRQLYFGALSNLVSGSPLGYSQVTSVVGHNLMVSRAGPAYPIRFFARLVYPYFVELSNPIPFTNVTAKAQPPL
jgi:hypothetical protein